VKIDNGTGGSRETSTGKPERVDEREHESINFFAELKGRNVYKAAINASRQMRRYACRPTGVATTHARSTIS